MKIQYLSLSHIQIIKSAHALSYDGAVLWNSLSTELRSAQSLSAFKRGLECWLA
jgi:hypothetical protein